METNELKSIDSAMAVDDLTAQQITELQSALAILGYPIGDIDGMIGPKTRNAWAEYKADVFAGRPDLVDQESVGKLGNDVMMPNYPMDNKGQTIEAIQQECKRQKIWLPAQIAYVLATVEWETAQAWHPVREAFWKTEEWRKKNLRYAPYYGRGYCQITWKNNYEKYGKLLGIDLVNQPDLALEPHNALFILVHGFKTGAFTGRKLEDYITSTKCDFVNARRCINGTDKASTIAKLADTWLRKIT